MRVQGAQLPAEGVGATPPPLTTAQLRELFATLPAKEFAKVAKEEELKYWERVNKFCGECGGRMARHESEQAMVCGGCGRMVYPVITPAVICLVQRGDEVLLQRNSHYKLPFWTLVAGFVEPGETFEQAVAREVMEEANIRINNIRYFKSQIWPFPSNMMVGFMADYASGELRADGDEVVESHFFPRTALMELPLPKPFSIARHLIDAFINAK